MAARPPCGARMQWARPPSSAARCAVRMASAYGIPHARDPVIRPPEKRFRGDNYRYRATVVDATSAGDYSWRGGQGSAWEAVAGAAQGVMSERPE